MSNKNRPMSSVRGPLILRGGGGHGGRRAGFNSFTGHVEHTSGGELEIGGGPGGN